MSPSPDSTTLAALETARGLIALYERWLEAGENPYMLRQDTLEQKIAVLRQVESVLDLADARGRQFYFAAR